MFSYFDEKKISLSDNFGFRITQQINKIIPTFFQMLVNLFKRSGFYQTLKGNQTSQDMSKGFLLNIMVNEVYHVLISLLKIGFVDLLKENKRLIAQ